MTIRAAVFDRDGVLVATDRKRFTTEVLARFPVPEAEAARRWRAWLAGRVLTSASDEQAAIAGFLEDLAEDLGLHGEARARLVALDYRVCVRGFPDAGPALSAVRTRGVAVGVLTNNSAAASAEGMLEAAGLAGLVDVALSAQMVGAAKPDPRAYQAIAAAMSVDPEDCLFFDDSLESCIAARRLGMRAYRVDRSRTVHDIAGFSLCDLSAVPELLGGA